jgi:hypothetical protein
VVLEPGGEDVEIKAIETCRLLVASAVHHSYPLVLGSHSVHTSSEALAKGVEGINRIGKELVVAGRL